jgi:hypothetical protein
VSTLSPSSIKVTKSLEEQLQGVTNAEQIKAIMKAEIISSGLAHTDWDDSLLVENEPTVAPRAFAKSVTVNGVTHTIEGSTEIELQQAETAIYRAAMQPAATTQQTIEQPRNERGQFVAVEQTVSEETKAALQLQFQLGQIDSATYLEQSGAVADYLAKQGIPLADLRESVQEKSAARCEQSWAQATEEFLQSSVGADWPGGENMNILGRLIQENNLTDKPSVETLSAVWQYMKENNLAVENPEVTSREKLSEASQRISEATSAEQIMEVLRPNGSFLFGR